MVLIRINEFILLVTPFLIHGHCISKTLLTDEIVSFTTDTWHVMFDPIPFNQQKQLNTHPPVM